MSLFLNYLKNSDFFKKMKKIKIKEKVNKTLLRSLLIFLFLFVLETYIFPFLFNESHLLIEKRKEKILIGENITKTFTIHAYDLIPQIFNVHFHPGAMPSGDK